VFTELDTLLSQLRWEVNSSIKLSIAARGFSFVIITKRSHLY
jgi:hypothetical protein